MFDEFIEYSRFDVAALLRHEEELSPASGWPQPTSLQDSAFAAYELSDSGLSSYSPSPTATARWLLDGLSSSETIRYTDLLRETSLTTGIIVEPSPFEFDSTFSSNDPSGDDDGDGVSNEDDPDWITDTVVGRRPRNVDEGPDMSGGGDPGTGVGGSGDGTSGTGTPPTSSLDCRDRNALAAEQEIEAHKDDNLNEHGSLIYKGADGSVRHSPPIHGNETQIPIANIENWMAANGVSYSQVIGFVHNHPAYEYGTSDEAAAINRYPSTADWNVAAYMTGKGAGGAGGSGYALYIISPDGDLREFNYAQKSEFTKLSSEQKEAGSNLPKAMKSDGSSC